LDGERGNDDNEADRPPALTVDTWADKGIRFGCGALLATLIVASLAIYVGAGTVFGAVVVCVVASVSAGMLAVVGGERFVKTLLRLMRWL
jgi:hypothetical protein